MLGDLLRAVAQLDERRTRSCIWQSILAGIAAFIALVLGAQLLIGAFGETGYVWLDWAINIVGIAGASVLAWLVFPMVFSVTIGFFADRVCDAVEARHFPGLPPARPVPLTESIIDGVRLAGLAILLNLLALPLYLMPGPNIVIYLALNGYLLGREYHDTVAIRRRRRAEIPAQRRRHRAEIWLTGALIAGILLVPFLNLLAPVIGIALMTLRHHRWNGGGGTITGQ